MNGKRPKTRKHLCSTAVIVTSRICIWQNHQTRIHLRHYAVWCLPGFFLFFFNFIIMGIKFNREKKKKILTAANKDVKQF